MAHDWIEYYQTPPTSNPNTLTAFTAIFRSSGVILTTPPLRHALLFKPKNSNQ